MQTIKIGSMFWNVIIENGKRVYTDGPYTTAENAYASRRMQEH